VGIFSSLCAYITYFPLAIFIGLILAGLNIPISEDLAIITSALVAQVDKTLIVPLYVAIFSGVVISDHMVYWEGRLIHKGVLKIKFISKMLDQSKMEIIRRHLHRYGLLTYIVCRFIPFGVRNTLFMTSGIMNMRYRDFIFYDTVAAILSTSIMFTLFYHLGATVERPLRAVGTILLAALLFVLAGVVFRLLVVWRRKLKAKRGTDTLPPVAG